MAQISLPSSLNDPIACATLHASVNGSRGRSKRALDLVLAVPALVLAGPVMLAVAALVGLTSGPPAVYRQTRLGLGGKTFTIYKFRTMRHDAEAHGPVWPLEPYGEDPRCTTVGRFLRWTGLDELPQLINVLKGDMSLVGPRPERPEFAGVFTQQYNGYELRHRVRPGLTGLAQIRGLRGNTSIENRVSCDLVYVEAWTLGLDIQILLTTFLVFLKSLVSR